MTSLSLDVPLPQAEVRGGEALARLSRAALAARFAEAGPPADLDRFEGDPRCLALLPMGALQRWASSARSPWIGKSFRLERPGLLVGHNRLRLLGGARALAFTAAVGQSLIDGRPALVLDYDFVDTTNPRWQRRIHDELREVEPGLLVGPVCWRSRRRLRVLCWFVVQADTAGR